GSQPHRGADGIRQVRRPRRAQARARGGDDRGSRHPLKAAPQFCSTPGAFIDANLPGEGAAAMRIAAWAGVVALAVAGPAVAQTRPTVAQAFDNSCVAEAIPVAGICRVVGTATLAPGPDGRQMGWRLYDVVSSSGRRGLSVILADD